MSISNFGKTLANKVGKYAYIGAAIGVAIQYWGFVNLENIHPMVPTGLYIYVICSGIAATPYIYFEKKAKVVLSKLCPYCDTPLEKLPKYKCSKCGVLEPKKE